MTDNETDKVRRVKPQVDAGTYDHDAKLYEATDKLLDVVCPPDEPQHVDEEPERWDGLS